ncbi:hypothetical protein EV360DRAFT_73668 [Lentinula raphanica]|nr:hypothetical protein EV360DRAFT_73668 [Lentinula raphanica]
MVPNHEFSNTPLCLESKLEDWAEDAEHWVKVLCQDCTLGFSAAINQQGSIKLQTSTRKAIMSDVKSAYKHISLKVLKEAASLNGLYMQQYKALSEALIDIMAFFKIAEEAGKLYPNVKNEGGQDSRMELFLNEPVKIHCSATRAKMQKAEAAAKEAKNSTQGAKGKESTKTKEKTVERASVKPIDTEQKFMEEIEADLAAAEAEDKAAACKARPKGTTAFLRRQQASTGCDGLAAYAILAYRAERRAKLYRKGTPVKVADQDSPMEDAAGEEEASPKAKSKFKSKKKSKVVKETPEPMADPDILVNGGGSEEPKPKAKAKGTNAEEETMKASKGKGKQKRQDQDVGAAGAAEPYSTTAGPETIIQPMVSGVDIRKNTLGPESLEIPPKSLGFPGFPEILKDFQRFSKQLGFFLMDQTKWTKVYLDLADTCDPGDSQNWDLICLLQGITHSQGAEYSAYTEAQLNALIKFHGNQLFDSSIKARFYARHGLASQAIIDNARKAFRMKSTMNAAEAVRSMHNNGTTVPRCYA